MPETCARIVEYYNSTPLLLLLLLLFLSSVPFHFYLLRQFDHRVHNLLLRHITIIIVVVVICF